MSDINIKEFLKKIIQSAKSDSDNESTTKVNMYKQPVSKKTGELISLDDTYNYENLWNEKTLGKKTKSSKIEASVNNIIWLLNNDQFLKLISSEGEYPNYLTLDETSTPYGTHTKINVSYSYSDNGMSLEISKIINANNLEVKELEGTTDNQGVKKWGNTASLTISDQMVNDLKQLGNDNFNYVLNKKMSDAMRKILNLSKQSTTTNLDLPTLGGGAVDMVGEYEAYKNTMIIEKSNIKMIGGGDDIWAPGLEKDAVKRSTLFFQALDSIEAELANKGKKLASNDSNQIRLAINSLAKRESNIYGELETLQTYAQLLEKYKDNKNHQISGELTNKDSKVTELVSKYFKNVSRADNKASKLNIVLSQLLNSAFTNN